MWRAMGLIPFHDREKQAKALTGFIAQEVEQAVKEMGYKLDEVQHPKNQHEHYTIGYASFVAPLVKVVQ